ncbi:hypothetical protein ABD91_21035 [Lysinibacillus sphaericus]|uniref:hypothetical protein n=1 Tax=Lysinibacillus sphaericus TaxID=1421 RepID=UPI0018CDE310|nr:hypothetical protein [Lysinibacillus sphaericus]MBG9693226.1 hypothetical protein [Lysinibacillus sphaericus]
MQNQNVAKGIVIEAIRKSNSFNMLVHNLIVLENQFKAVSQLLEDATEDEQILIGHAISSQIESFLRREIEHTIVVELINLDKLTFSISLRLEAMKIWGNILNFSILPTFEYSFSNEIMDASMDAESYINELAVEMEDLKKHFNRLTAKSVMSNFKAKLCSILQPNKKEQYNSEVQELDQKIEKARAEYVAISRLYERDRQFKDEIGSFMREIKAMFSHAKHVNKLIEQS